MLVVTRKENEEVVIDGGIVLKVISTSHGRVKLGIEAPADVRIVRGEIAFQEELQHSALPQGAVPKAAQQDVVVAY